MGSRLLAMGIYLVAAGIAVAAAVYALDLEPAATAAAAVGLAALLALTLALSGLGLRFAARRYPDDDLRSVAAVVLSSFLFVGLCGALFTPVLQGEELTLGGAVVHFVLIGLLAPAGVLVWEALSRRRRRAGHPPSRDSA